VADGRTLAAAALVAALATQAALSAAVPREWSARRSIGAPPDAKAVALASLGETRSAAAALALLLQSFDTQGGRQQRLGEMDHGDTVAWLARIGELAPDAGYDVYLATRLYAHVVPAALLRPLLDWTLARFLQAPGANWVSLAHAVHAARYRLHDRPLALDYARALREHAVPGMPGWARQMEVLLLADLGEADAARALYQAMHASGALSDPREQDLLATRIGEAERRDSADGRHRVAPVPVR
jgi:hypothetical protein